jgi:hypothetical protein
MLRIFLTDIELKKAMEVPYFDSFKILSKNAKTF